MKWLKLILFTVITFILTWLLMFVANNPLVDFRMFDSQLLNVHLNYQLSGLVIACLSLLVTFVFATKLRLSYLTFNHKGKMYPDKVLRIHHVSKWEEDGWSIGLIMVGVIAITTLLQVRGIGLEFRLINLLMVIPFAATNAFTEEVIFRLSYLTVGENETNRSSYGLIMGSLVFGISHYWGLAPNGLFGALISIYLGYFLSKSIIETKSMYWAFMIHFLLDVAILFFMLNIRV